MSTQHLEVEARGLRFDALAEGPKNGPLVLLLHGFPQSSAIWRRALHDLAAAGFRAVAIDQRGYGAGAQPEGVAAYRLEEPVEDALAVAETLGHRRFHVVGHDWGGTVAWGVAAVHPGRVRSVTSLATPHSAALREALRGARQQLRMLYIPVLRMPLVAETAATALDGRLLLELLVRTGLAREHARRDVDRLREIGLEGPLNWYRALGPGLLRFGAPVAAPSLYVWPDRDPAFTRLAAELTERYVSGPYHFVELQGASHWIPDEHWDEVSDLVVEHIRGAQG